MDPTRIILGAACCALSACAGKAPPPEPDPTPPKVTMTIERVREVISAKQTKLAGCFRAEAMNSEKTSEYVFQFDLSTSGKHTVTLVSESIPDQRSLRECILDVLHAVQFPAFDEPAKFVAEVPIRSGVAK